MSHYRAIPDYYDAEYAYLDILQYDVPFFLDRIPKRRQSILDIACGTGRASIPLAQAGHRVVGIDYDGDILALAKQKRDAVGIKENDLRLVHADALNLKLDQKFDYACIFFNTFLNFTTLKQQDQLLQSIRRHLRPNGRLWIDIFNPDLHLLAERDLTGIEPTTFFVPSLNRTVSRTMDIHRDPAMQVQQITFQYVWFDAMGQEHREENRFKLTWIFPRELQLLLERNGFKLEKLWGDYDGSDLENDSPRIIARAKVGPSA